MEHPGIVPVHALGCDADGRPYYAMKFVRGRTLRQSIAEYHAAPSALAFRDLLRRFVSVCQAVAYAHSKGVIHRDLKPANIMLGDYGETLILDWGLAKQLAADTADSAEPNPEMENLDALFASEVTGVGQVLGTPGYLPPEQAGGSGRVGPPADVYSLGAVLYKILCNRTPYQGSTAPDELLRGKQQPPAPPSRDCAGVPKALEAVCLRAMSTRPEDRYDAVSLAREIDRWLADDPVDAWREPPVVRALRWARHHKPVVAGVVVLLVSMTIALAVNNVMVRHEQARTESARLQADKASKHARAEEIQSRLQEHLARDNERKANLQLARTLVFQGEALALAGQWEPAKARYADGGERLTALGESRFPADVGLWNAFRAAPPPLLRCQVGSAAITATAFAPRGNSVLVATESGAIELRDIRTGRVVGPAFVPKASFTGIPTPDVARPSVNCLAFSTDGQLVASGSDDRTLTLWDANTGTPRRIFHGHSGPVTAVAFCGTKVLSGSVDKSVKLWDPDAPDALWTSPTQPGSISSIACSADGKVAFSGGSEPQDNLRVWDVPSRKLRRVFSGHTDNVAAVALSSDGCVGVSGSADGTVRIWDVSGQQPNEAGQIPGERGSTVSAVSLSLDKRRVFSGTLGGEMQLWSIERGQEIVRFGGDHARITSAAFSIDGRVAASGVADGTLLLWDASAGQESGRSRSFRGADAVVNFVAFSPDGLTALSDGLDHTVQLFDVATGFPVALLKGHSRAVAGVCFSPDGHMAVAAGKDGTVLLWDLQERSPGRPFTASTVAVNALAFSPDGTSLATAAADGTVVLWDVRPGTPARLGQIGRHSRAVTSLAFTPDGKSVVSGDDDGFLHIWPLATPGFNQTAGTARTLGHQDSAVTCLALSPDARFALSGARGVNPGYDYALILWDIAGTGKPRKLAAQRGLLTGVGFTPDGRYALSCCQDGTVMLWDMDHDGEPFRGTIGRGEPIESVAFSHDGRQLMCGGDDKTLRLWDFDGPAGCDRLQKLAEAALKTLQTAPQNAPTDPAALIAVGNWYAFRGRPDWAADFYARAADAGAHPPALTWARCAWLNGDLATASDQMHIALLRGEAPAPYLNQCLSAIESSRHPPTTLPGAGAIKSNPMR